MSHESRIRTGSCRALSGSRAPHGYSPPNRRVTPEIGVQRAWWHAGDYATHKNRVKQHFAGNVALAHKEYHAMKW